MQKNPIAHQRVLDCAYIGLDTLYQDFHIPQQGYNEKQAEESRIKYGKNVLSGRASDTALYRLRRAFINPFTIILFVLAAVSFLTDVVLASNFSRDITTAVIILCMLLVSGIVRFIQEMRAKRIADHLTQMVSSTVLVLRNNQWMRISSEDLVVGDKVRLFAGERVPADIRLTWAKDLFVSQSVLTGESAILEKNPDTLVCGQAQSYSDYHNITFMGSSITGGTGEGIVLAVGKDTVYGGFSAAESHPKNGFDRGANSIAWVLIRFMAVLIPIVFVACGLTKGDWLAAFLFALSVAVGLTPEMLPMVINACLAKGSAAMGKKQTVVKNINAMQGFGSMDILCVDKTGTLTGNKITLEYFMDVLGNECQYTLDLAYLNSLYHTGVQNHLDDAILRYREIPGQRLHYEELEQQHPKLDEFPFDHERRFASVLVRHGEENLLIIKGSVAEVYQKCSYIEYQSERHKIDIHGHASVHAIVDEMLEDGMKALAVAYKPLRRETISPEDENGLTLLGYLAFFDAPKQSAADAIAKLQKLHVNVRVLTGDNQNTAVSICRRLGIDTTHTLTGPELERLTDNEISVKLEHTTVFSQLSPKQKVQVVQTLRANGHTVGFLGDGMNDLPAIVESDVGYP
ncbi:MAG: HAD-IC family P-type ATPase [Acutalibacteraceae bacterium]